MELPGSYTRIDTSAQAAENVPDIDIGEPALPADKIAITSDELEQADEHLEKAIELVKSIWNLLPYAPKGSKVSKQLEQELKDAQEKVKAVREEVEKVQDKMPSKSIYDPNKGGRGRKARKYTQSKKKNGLAKIQRHRTSRVSRGKR